MIKANNAKPTTSTSSPALLLIFSSVAIYLYYFLKFIILHFKGTKI